MQDYAENKGFILPGIFTSLNLLGGIAAILLAVRGDYAFSSWMIIIAILFDGLDGKIARWLNRETSFGLYLDSLADLVSSGIAPVVLVYKVTFDQMPWFFSCFCIIYVFSGSYRLARFIAVQKGDRSQGYIGLPIPLAGMSLAASWLFLDALSIPVNSLLAAVLMTGLSALMISTVPYAWPRLIWKSAAQTFLSALKLTGALALVLFTKYTLFPLIFLYILYGVGRWIIVTVKSSGTVHIVK